LQSLGSYLDEEGIWGERQSQRRKRKRWNEAAKV
jgi:hypothetical protein